MREEEAEKAENAGFTFMCNAIQIRCLYGKGSIEDKKFLHILDFIYSAWRNAGYEREYVSGEIRATEQYSKIKEKTMINQFSKN